MAIFLFKQDKLKIKNRLEAGSPQGPERLSLSLSNFQAVSFLRR